jgi:hypothetical protein
MTIPLLIGVLYLLFFVYRKIRIDLFKDKVFKIQCALFLIAADNPDEFLKNNSSYRYFERILNETLIYTEDFSLLSSVIDVIIRYDYAKRQKIKSFDFNHVKEQYLNKIKSAETKKEVSKLLDDFQFSFAWFLMTRTFLGTVASLCLISLLSIFFLIKIFLEQGKKDLKELIVNFSSNYLKVNTIISNSKFAYVASMF